MKVFKIFVTALLLLPISLNAQWNLTYSSAGGGTVFGLAYTPDSVVGIARYGNFYYSNDNGTTFSNYPVATFPCAGSSTNFYGVTAYSESDIRVTTQGTTAGTHNSHITGLVTSGTCHTVTTSSSGVNGISYHGNTGYILLNDDKLYKSTDGGDSWIMTKDLNPYCDPLEDVIFVDDTLGFFFSKNGTVINTYKTINGGTSVTLVSSFSDTYNNYKSSFFVDAFTGYLIVNDATGFSRLYKTTNSGNSWLKVFQGDLNYTLNDVYFTSIDTGYLCGKGLIMMTTDGGNTWGIQRFYSGEDFSKIKMIGSRGVVAGSKGSTMIVYQTSNFGGAYKPFSYYYLGFPSCCDGIACGITNNGDFSSSYSWFVDGTLVSSSHSITPVTYSGTHTIMLVRQTGPLIDTFKRSIYFAPVLSPTYVINSTMDTSLCPTQTLSTTVNFSYSGFNYSAWLDGSQIGLSVPGTGSSVTINTGFDPDSTDFITIHGESPYYYCPGNTIYKNRPFTVFPNTAAIPITLDVDTVCPNGICNASLDSTINTCHYYFHFVGGTYSTIYTYFTSSGAPYSFPPTTVYGSGYYYYKITDMYGCTNYSDSIPVVVDSLDGQLFSPSYMCHVNDTMTIQNISPGTGFNWVFPPGTIVIDSSSQKYRTVIFTMNVGRDSIILYQKGYTGSCIDTFYFPVFVYTDPSPPTGYVCQKQELTVPSYNIPFDCAIEYDHEIFAHHIDSHGNTYVGVWEEMPYSYYYIDKSVLYKYDSLGNFLWSIDCFGTSTDFRHISFSGIASDSYDNIYVSGYLTATGQLLIGSDTTYVPTSPGPWSYISRYFLMKLNSVGHLIWMNYSSIYNPDANVFAMVSGPTVVNDTSVFVIFPQIDSLINDNNIALFGSPTYEFGAFEFDTSGDFKSFLTIEPTGARDNTDHCSGGSGGKQFLDPKYDIYFDKIIISGWGQYDLVSSTYNSFLRSYATNGTPLYSVSDLELKLGSYEICDYVGWPIAETPGTTDMRSHSAFSVSSTGSSYTSYNLLSKNMLNEFCLDNGVYYLETGSGDKINYPLHGSAYQKHTIDGTLQYTMYFPGVKIQNLVANRDNMIYGIGNWTRSCGLPSNDGHNGGFADTSRYINSVFFCYDTLGNLQWAENIAGTEVDLARSLIRQNPCDNNLYFLMGSNTDYVFMGDTNTNHGFITQYIYSPDVICATTPPSACSWGYSTQTNQPVKKLSSIKVFPNPFNTKFEIISKNSGLLMINIVDVSGRIIFNKSFNGELQTSIDLSGAQNGVYFATIIKSDHSKETVLIEKQ